MLTLNKLLIETPNPLCSDPAIGCELVYLLLNKFCPIFPIFSFAEAISVTINVPFNNFNCSNIPFILLIVVHTITDNRYEYSMRKMTYLYQQAELYRVI